MSDYLRSNCDTGCKTVWSGVLKYTLEDSWDSFYKDFCESDVIHAHTMSFVTSLGSHDPKCYHLAQKYIGFPAKIVINRILTVHPYSCS